MAEALCEVRFECEESRSLPEIVVGRLAEYDRWRQFRKNRLPISDIPAAIRSQDPSLRNQPVLELREQQGGQIAKIGVNVLSFHCLEPYPGWAAFKPEIDTVLDFLFRSFQDFTATRLGFRYVNIFTREDHGIESTRDLNYTVSVAGSALESPQNLNYIMVCTEKHTVMVRIASPEFVVNATKPNIRALVDLDVFTPAGWRTSSVDEAKDWVEKAHECEKEQFFRLFTEEMKARLVEAQ